MSKMIVKEKLWFCGKFIVGILKHGTNSVKKCIQLSKYTTESSNKHHHFLKNV